MGRQDSAEPRDLDERRAFTKRLLADLRALEQMIDGGQIESGVRRIGVEQEMFLIDANRQPAPRSIEVLDRLDDEHYTTELARFNLEFNVDPMLFGGSCLSQMESDLNRFLAKARAAAAEEQAEIGLIGILPTLGKADLELSNMTPVPRYFALNEALCRMRGSDYEFRFIGTDELIIKHDSVMLEACNTSFQVHFQVAADEFARFYNFSQAVAGPVLAAAVNSPILFGKRLWQETRIALFQQALDIRSSSAHVEDRKPRVFFGDHWVRESAVEIFREDIARMRVVLASETREDPFKVLAEGRAPKLEALQLHNGTVYRWTRPCYGVTDGKPHLRIENRILPAGPTVIDEVANAAFWFGLISGLLGRYDDITRVMDFDDAKTNFLAAARRGLGAQFSWIDGQTVPARDLILRELIPIARDGLTNSGIDAGDIERFLGVLERRVASEQTGAQWMLRSMSRLKERPRGERCTAIMGSMLRQQHAGRPVSEWSLADATDAGGWERNYLRVSQYMTTDVFTVTEDEVVDLVACVMDWAHIRHIPVEDDEGHLVGIVSYRSLLRLLARDGAGQNGVSVAVSEIMHTNPITVAPDTRTIDAIDLMRRERVACLPVVKDDRLVGIITEHDFTDVARQLLEEKLRDA
ncbi:MAG: CBS domain-containing protein [Phycisphaerales bacterium]